MATKRRAWLFERLEDRRCLAIEAQFASNINQTDPWSSVPELASVGSLLYFIAKEPGASQFDLWRTNETKTGTIRLASNVGSRPYHTLTSANGSLFFRGFDEVHGYELWKSDGSVAGTMMVKDLTPGPGNSRLSELMEYNGKLLFLANGDLTISDGTDAGTVQVEDFVAGASDGITELEHHAGEVYFNPQNNLGEVELWKTNGQVDNAVSLGVSTLNIREITSVGENLFFAKDFGELWKTNGQPNAAELVDATSYPTDLINVSGELYYSYFGLLSRSDGTASGTVGFKALNSINNFFNFNGRLFFAGEDSNGIELWTSDGTEVGTFMVKDLFPGKPVDDFFPNSSHPSDFTEANGKLYFKAANQLWTTNGTALGTQPVAGGGVETLTSHNDSLYYGQGTLKKLNTLTSKSTSIQRLGSGVGSSSPSNVVELNGQYYLAADDGMTGNELRRLNADGSTTLVRDIMPGSAGSIPFSAPALTIINGSIYFSAIDPVRGSGLWMSDGTTAGTRFLANVEATTDFDSGIKFLSVGNTLYFNGLSTDGFELWKTDGTVAGTLMVKDINPGDYPNQSGLAPKSSRPSNLVNFNGTLFFNADDGDGVRRLWKSDGTPAGTNLALGREIFNVSPMVVKNNQLYFTAKDARNGAFWKSDGTLAGTERLFGGEVVRVGNSPEPTLLNGQFYFVGDNETYGSELWKSDGTPAGTKLVKDIFVGPVSSFATTKLYNFNNRLYFVARTGETGFELWQSDGTATGTMMVQDINVGSNSSLPGSLTNLNGTIYFLAYDTPFEFALWRTNGTAAGASRVEIDASGPDFKFPSNLSLANERIFFSAHSVLGNELFTVAPVSPTILSTNTSIAYREGTSRTFLASTAILTDRDTPILNGGKVTVSFKSSYLVGDQLFVNAIPSLSIVSDSVRFNNVAFGTISGGMNGQPLSISLDSRASVIAVQTLLRGLAFRSDSRNPSAAKRTVQIALRDGEGGAAAPLLVTIAMIRVNDAPTFSNLPTSQSYRLNAAPFSLAPLATISDVDNPNLNGGQLVVTAFGGEVAKNRLQFTGGLFSVDANLNLIYNGIAIGKVNLNGGRNNIPLRITFNSNAKLNAVSELLQSIKFSTLGSTLTATRRVTIAVSDGAGGNRSASINIAVSR